MAPKLVLMYFDITGAAESIRWNLEQGGLEWEDKRLSWEEFGVLKPCLPTGQVPVLEVDGTPLAQSLAILRYCGKLAELYPTDAWEAAKCDSIMDCTVDFSMNFRPFYFEKIEAKKMEMGKDLAENLFPKWLENMEKHLGVTEGLYFGDKMTTADIAVADRVQFLKSGFLDGIPTTIADSYPKLIALHEAIVAEPKIAAFIAKHAK